MPYYPPLGLLPGFPDSGPQPLGTGATNSSWFAGDSDTNAILGYFKFYAGNVLLGDDRTSPKLHNGVGITIDDGDGINIYSGVGTPITIADDPAGVGNTITLAGNAGVGGIDIVPLSGAPVHVGPYNASDQSLGLVFSDARLWIYDLSDPKLKSAAFETRQLFANDGTVIALDWSDPASIGFLDGAASIDSSGVISGNGSALSGITASQVGLGSVTNDVQTKAAIVPNTAPAAGKILAGNAGGTAYAPVTVAGSGATISLASTGTMTISAIVNASLSNSAITIAGTSTALGASITLDTISGVASNGFLKRTAANTWTNVATIAGWTAPTGSALRTGYATTTATLNQVSQTLKALVDDLVTQGLIGA